MHTTSQHYHACGRLPLPSVQWILPIHSRSDKWHKLCCMQGKVALLRQLTQPSRTCHSTQEEAKAKIRHVCGSHGSQTPYRLVIYDGKMSTDKRDPLSKRKRTKLILSRMTIVEDDYDYKGRGNVTDIDFHILKVFLNPFSSIGYKGKQLGTGKLIKVLIDYFGRLGDQK